MINVMSEKIKFILAITNQQQKHKTITEDLMFIDKDILSLFNKQVKRK